MRRTHEPAGGRFGPRRALLAAVLAAAVAAAGCDGSYGTDRISTELTATAIEVPLVPSPTPLPPATQAPDLVRPVEVSTPPPSQAPTDEVTGPTSLTEPTGPSGAVTMAAAAPVRLQIPSIGVDTTLIDLGLQPDGTLEVPPGGFPAGWYTGAPTPGELGPAIIAGHVDWGGRPGVFFALRDLTPDDEIVVTRQDGSTARFRVTRVERFGKDGFPTQAVYGDLDHAGLRLITCGGDFDPRARSYRDNVVVFAALAGS